MRFGWAIRLIGVISLIAWSMLAAAGATDGSAWRSLEDLRHGRIGYVNGMVFGPFLQKTYPEAQLISFNNPSDLIQGLKSGKVDTAVLARISARAVVASNSELAILDEAVMRFPLGIGFGKRQSALRRRFDSYLERIRSDGRYREINDRWFVNDPEKAAPPDYRPASPREKRVAAVAIADMPYVAFKDGRFVGFDIEILQSFAAEENIDLKIQALDFGALLPAIASGKADIIADGLAITEERRKAVDFSAPYGEETGAAIVMRRRIAQDRWPPSRAQGVGVSSQELQSIDDLKGRRIAVIVGASTDAYATRTFPQAQIVRLASKTDVLSSVQTGSADAGLLDTVSAHRALAETPNLAILADDLEPLPIAAAFRQSDVKLRERFDRFLSGFQSSGALSDLHESWFAGKTLGAPGKRLDRGPTLRVGVAPDLGLPFVDLQDGQYVGSEVELAYRFAQAGGFQLVLAPMKFDALMTSLATGKIDLIVSNLAMTAERAKEVAFSRPYGEETLAAFVRAADRAVAETTPPLRPASWLDGLRQSVASTFVVEQRWKLLADGLLVTLQVSILSTLFGTLVGALICYLRMSDAWLARRVGKFYIGFIRGLPVLILLMLIFYVVFAHININAVLVAVIAFGLNFGAYVAEIFRSGIRSVDRGQYEAGIAMGFTSLQAFLFFVAPQGLRNILPVYRGEFISLVKMTSIVGYIGVQDLTKASDIIRSRTFDAFFPLLMVSAAYFLVIWLLGLLLDFAEHRTNPRRIRSKIVAR